MKVLVCQIVTMNTHTGEFEYITKVFNLAGKNVDIRARNWRSNKIRSLSEYSKVITKHEFIKIVN